MIYKFSGTLSNCSYLKIEEEFGDSCKAEVVIPWNTITKELDNFVAYSPNLEDHPDLIDNLSRLKDHLDKCLYDIYRMREIKSHFTIRNEGPYDF